MSLRKLKYKILAKISWGNKKNHYLNKLNKLKKHSSHALQYSTSYELDVINIIDENDVIKNRAFVEKMHKNPLSDKPKSILCFTFCSVGDIYAGYRTILSINNYLQRLWNCKTYLCFFPITEDDDLISQFRINVAKYFPDFEYEIVAYKDIDKIYVDIAWCTFWLTAYPLLRFNNCKEKHQLIQDQESLFYNGIISSEAERTLTFGYYKWANSFALKKYCNYVDSQAPTMQYKPEINTSLFYPDKNKSCTTDKYKIIVYGRPNVKRNAFELMAPVLQKLKQKWGDKIEIFSVGERYNPSNFGLTNIVTNLGYIPVTQLASLCRKCDIGISFITTPTYSYQHLEYMASGLCLVTNAQIGVEDFLVDGENAVVCEPVIDIIVEKVNKLIENPAELKRIAENGIKTVLTHSCPNSYQEIADFILNKNKE